MSYKKPEWIRTLWSKGVRKYIFYPLYAIAAFPFALTAVLLDVGDEWVYEKNNM